MLSSVDSLCYLLEKPICYKKLREAKAIGVNECGHVV